MIGPHAIVICYTGCDMDTMTAANVATAIAAITVNHEMPQVHEVNCEDLTKLIVNHVASKSCKQNNNEEIEQTIVFFGERYKDLLSDGARFSAMLVSNVNHAKHNIEHGYKFEEDYALLNAVRILNKKDINELPQKLVKKYKITQNVLDWISFAAQLA